jgi:hypothetical protein
MRSRLLAVLGGLALTVAGLAGGQLVSAGPAAAEPAHCSGSLDHPDSYSDGHIAFKINAPGTLIRDHPYEDCNLREEAYGSAINVHCSKVNDNSVLWFYVEDMNTGVAGWARWDNLRYDIPYTSGGYSYNWVVGGRCSGVGWWEVWRNDQGVLIPVWGG